MVLTFVIFSFHLFHQRQPKGPTQQSAYSKFIPTTSVQMPYHSDLCQ